MPGLEILTDLLKKFLSAVPNIAGALFLLIVGWIVAKSISGILRKFLLKTRIDKLTDRLNEIDLIQRTKIKVLPSLVLSKFLYYFLLLIFLVAATDVLGMEALSSLVKDIINYLPQLITAIILLIVGLLLADSLRSGVKTTCDSLGIPSANVIAGFAFWFVFLTVGVSALSQAGIDTQFIMANLTVILAGSVFAFALGYGLASRNIVANFLASFYSKDKIKIGDVIGIDGVKGEVIGTDRTSVTLLSGDKKVVLPMSKFTSENLEIFEQS
jgi:small-conductance mechanosensitive channel